LRRCGKKRVRRRRQAARDRSPQCVRRPGPARAARALRQGGSVQQLLQRAEPRELRVFLGRRQGFGFFAENNFFRVAGGIRPDFLIERFNGKALFARRTFVNGTTASNEIDLVAAYNAVNSTDLSTNVGWAPTANQSTGIDPVAQIANTLPTQTGPIVW
jgi:hypothetical protein